MLMALSLAGCKSAGKKDANAASAGGGKPGPDAAFTRGPDRAAPAIPPATAPERTVSAPAGGASGVLAGQVLDNASRRLPNAFIQVSEQADGSRRGAPVEVAADNQGYFLIQGVQAGKRYQLTARARDGSRTLTGSVWATPPDPKLVICLNDDPGAQSPTGERGWAPGPRRAAELGPPMGAAPWPYPSQPATPGAAWPPSQAAVPPPDPTPSVQGDPLQPRAKIRPENTASEATAARDDVPAAVPNPTASVGGWTAPAAAAAAVPAPQFGPTRVPSCVLTGQTCYNFALNDLSGQPWEFRQRRGRLMLVDFWGTWCPHCLAAVPQLNIVQERYGPYGLEVVGIAYESGTPAEQVRKVNDTRTRLRMNYRVLLGSDRDTCPVRRQFGVRAWPTLVLLDENGRIIWRGEGFDAQHMRELEGVIQQKLAQR
jgi:thiol-disulfide isomerase/thioredoxin